MALPIPELAYNLMTERDYLRARMEFFRTLIPGFVDEQGAYSEYCAIRRDLHRVINQLEWLAGYPAVLTDWNDSRRIAQERNQERI